MSIDQPPSPTGEEQPAGVVISKLSPTDIKVAWPTEPHHFTPWLLDHSEELSEVLGLQVQLEDREHSVGAFSLDLIGSVAGNEDQVVIVENQYGQTDHSHLGQLLTYAAGTKPAVIIWIAEKFREEHRAALDWLNESTPPQIKFFGVKLALVRLEGAPANLVAPRLELAVKPNDWEKIAHTEVAAGTAAGGGVSGVNALYKRFWEQFAEPAKERGWTNATPPAQNWWSMPSGTATINWNVSYSQFGCRSELYFGHPDPRVNQWRLQQLLDKADLLLDHFGVGELIFDPIEGKQATRIDTQWQGPKIQDEETWQDVISWMLDRQQRLRDAVAAVGGLPTGMPPLQ